MAVDTLDLNLKDESGQSLLEVVFLIPFLFMFVGLLYKIMMVMQMAMVNTQYARSQLYVLTANSSEYPRLEFRLFPNMFANQQQDRMILGVSDPEALMSSTGLEGTIEQIPQTQKIQRTGATVLGSDERGEVSKRTEIRVRNTVGICTQLNAVSNKKPMNDVNMIALASKRWPFGQEVCQYGGLP